jgi:hypothetical protein
MYRPFYNRIDIEQTGRSYPLILSKAADMFDIIARLLPPYQQLYTTRTNMQPHLQDAQDLALTELMSYIYADMAELCLDLYCLFTRALSGKQYIFFSYVQTTSTRGATFRNFYGQTGRRWPSPITLLGHGGATIQPGPMN